MTRRMKSTIRSGIDPQCRLQSCLGSQSRQETIFAYYLGQVSLAYFPILLPGSHQDGTEILNVIFPNFCDSQFYRYSGQLASKLKYFWHVRNWDVLLNIFDIERIHSLVYIPVFPVKSQNGSSSIISTLDAHPISKMHPRPIYSTHLRISVMRPPKRENFHSLLSLHIQFSPLETHFHGE